MHWAQLQETQFTPWSSSEIVENSQPALITPNTSFLIMKRDFMHNFRIFCTQIPAVLRIHLSMKWTPDFMGKKSNCESIPSLCTRWRNKLKKKKILATGPCSFKARTTAVLHGYSCNNFVALCGVVFETLISKATKFSKTFSSKLIFKIQLH